jgi:SAM-dependent methyltransferase
VALPPAAAGVDVVLALQVIEHIWTPPELLAEAARVLRPGGLLVLTTPNRLTFSPGLGRGQRPTNPFHVREYDAAELTELVGRHLEVVGVQGVHAGPRLQALDGRFAGGSGEQRGAGGFVRAQLASPPDDWPPDLARAVRSVTSDDFVVCEQAPDAALDLLVVGRRPAGPA